MSKFFKGVAKVVKNIGKGIAKVFKKVVKSKIFKVALVAVAVYFGGAALGLWGGAGATGAATAAVGSTAAPAAAATSLAAPVSTATLAATTAAPVAATSSGLASTTGIASALTGTAAPIASGVATATEIASSLTAAAAPAATTGGGFLSSLTSGAKAVGSFVKANPLAASMGLNALASATSPDELDMIEAQEAARKREFEQTLESRRENLTGFNTLPLLHQAQGTGTLVQNRRTGGN